MNYIGIKLGYRWEIPRYMDISWLVVSNIFYFHNICDNPSQLTFIFFRGVETTNQIWVAQVDPVLDPAAQRCDHHRGVVFCQPLPGPWRRWNNGGFYRENEQTWWPTNLFLMIFSDLRSQTEKHVERCGGGGYHPHIIHTKSLAVWCIVVKKHHPIKIVAIHWIIM